VISAALAGSLAAVWVLRAFPNSADECALSFEVDTFLDGRLWNPLPPLYKFFVLGTLMLLLCAPLALIIRRLGRLRSAAEPHAGYTTDRNL